MRNLAGLCSPPLYFMGVIVVKIQWNLNGFVCSTKCKENIVVPQIERNCNAMENIYVCLFFFFYVIYIFTRYKIRRNYGYMYNKI